ncbi:hypothetical protein [Rhodococcus opacus]|uniref:hypothetical protein n=1 Tax=Rhodococcus opacus TaxID=37919 RepID=UPI002955851C|nr:hypothetical protein [Rhodococcus opacus]MDV7086017.1 hypothetical protein [Rhodococcus opacus]
MAHGFVPAIGVAPALVASSFGGVPAWSAGLLLGLPYTVRNQPPFAHVPAAHAAKATATPLVWLVVIVAVGAVGLVLFRRRDRTTS